MSVACAGRLAMSSCHLNALPTNHYVPDPREVGRCRGGLAHSLAFAPQDWKWLLRDPKGAKQLINILVQEAPRGKTHGRIE